MEKLYFEWDELWSQKEREEVMFQRTAYFWKWGLKPGDSVRHIIDNYDGSESWTVIDSIIYDNDSDGRNIHNGLFRVTINNNHWNISDIKAAKTI